MARIKLIIDGEHHELPWALAELGYQEIPVTPRPVPSAEPAAAYETPAEEEARRQSAVAAARETLAAVLGMPVDSPVLHPGVDGGISVTNVGYLAEAAINAAWGFMR